MMYGRGFGGVGFDGGWGLLFLIGLIKVLFVVGVILLVVMLVRRSRMHHGMMMHMHGHGPMGGMDMGTPAADEAVAIARKRFASGELTKEQFDEIMAKLGT